MVKTDSRNLCPSVMTRRLYRPRFRRRMSRRKRRPGRAPPSLSVTTPVAKAMLSSFGSSWVSSRWVWFWPSYSITLFNRNCFRTDTKSTNGGIRIVAAFLFEKARFYFWQNNLIRWLRSIGDGLLMCLFTYSPEFTGVVIPLLFYFFCSPIIFVQFLFFLFRLRLNQFSFFWRTVKRKNKYKNKNKKEKTRNT